MNRDDYFTPEEVASRVDKDKATVYRWMKEGRLGFVKARINGGRLTRLIPKSVLAEFERKRKSVEIVEP